MCLLNKKSREWHGKPYYSLDSYCKNTFGEKIYKIALDGDMTCPNRDGTLDSRGCIFCSAGGSGDYASPCLFHKPHSSLSYKEIKESVRQQLEQGKNLFTGRETLNGKLQEKKTGRYFIAYFQSYTNTYERPEYLYHLFYAALQNDSIVGISIGTRPDCISNSTCDVLLKLRADFPNKFIWIELGLQTIHESTALYIRRGYTLNKFEECLLLLHKINIPIIVHVIIGLPYENQDMLLQTIHYLNKCSIQGIKLQLLHVLKGTDLEIDYKNHLFSVLSMKEYISILITCIEHLDPSIVIHRVTGDGPKDILLAPNWSSNKRKVLNTLHQEMKLRNTLQGKEWTNLE